MNHPSHSPAAGAAAAPTPPGTRNQGHVVAVRGTVVDVWFAHDLPAIYAVLRTTAAPLITVEVATQLDDHTVRGISLDPTQGLARGMQLVTDGQQLTVPVGKEIIGRMFDVFGHTIDHGRRCPRCPGATFTGCPRRWRSG